MWQLVRKNETELAHGRPIGHFLSAARGSQRAWSQGLRVLTVWPTCFDEHRSEGGRLPKKSQLLCKMCVWGVGGGVVGNSRCSPCWPGAAMMPRTGGAFTPGGYL